MRLIGNMQKVKEATMFRKLIKLCMPVVLAGLLLMTPLSALADVNPDAQSAAAAGIQYLAGHQGSDGSISGFGGESEWSVEAVEAAGQDANTFAHNSSPSLVDFLKTDVPAPTASTATVERKIIAIAAAGQDATNFGGFNYDAQLESQHIAGQIGDPTLLNDDIFGIIAIDAAHATALQSEAQDSLNYLLAHQGADGGFSYTTDSCAWCGSDNNDTAAALVAMYAAGHLGLVATNLDTARSNALAYLLGTQQTDGGFAYDAFSPSDGSSTAWSLMALNTIGEPVSAQAQLARSWLLQNQNPDGGFSYGAYGTTDSDTYTTANAVIALLGSTWLLRPAAPGLPSQPSVSAGSSQPQPSQSPPTAISQPAVATTGPDPTPPAILSTDTTTPDSTAPTKTIASISTDKPASPTRTIAHKLSGYTIYGTGLLILVALIWLVLEFSESTEEVS
jgi:hypothetical protein